jgi:hypothetical protein
MRPVQGLPAPTCAHQALAPLACVLQPARGFHARWLDQYPWLWEKEGQMWCATCEGGGGAGGQSNNTPGLGKEVQSGWVGQSKRGTGWTRVGEGLGGVSRGRIEQRIAGGASA